MRHLFLIKLALVVFMVCITMINSQSRVASFGSNPDYTYILFPQDISRVQTNNLTAFRSYCKSPWWGDIDQFNNKPNGTYTITGNEIIKKEAFFQESAKMHTTQNQFGGNYQPIENFTISLDGNCTMNYLRDIAKGNFTYDSNETKVGYVPFDYSLKHTLYDFNFRGITAFKVREIPAGILVALGKENTLALHKEITFRRGENTITSEHALWGWSKVGCNHIFGVRGTEGDAWFQNDYSTGPLYKLNIQAGADLQKIKAGINFYTKVGSQNYYTWQEDTGASSITSDTLLQERFVGSYKKSDWKKKSHESVLQAYGNVHWITQERFGINTFISLAYNGAKTGRALDSNENVESDRKETSRGMTLGFAPNININLGKYHHYVDIAFFSQYHYNRFNNKMMAWVNGGRTETYWDGSTPDEEEDIWEQCSYANQNAVDLGFEISTMFPVLNNNLGKLGFGFMLYGNARFNFLTKYFGDNNVAGSDNVFTVFTKRYNFEREIKFNTSLLFDYSYTPFRIKLEVMEPILHNLLQKTKIKNDDQVTYNHRKDPLWLSQKGLQLGLSVAYNFRMPALNSESSEY